MSFAIEKLNYLSHHTGVCHRCRHVLKLRESLECDNNRINNEKTEKYFLFNIQINKQSLKQK